MNDPIDESTALRLMQALDEGRLDSLFQAAHIDYSELNGFSGTSLTLGLPQDAVAHLIGSVRRAQGLTIVAGSWGDYAGWITLSAELVELLHEIDVRANFDFSAATGLPDDEIRHLKNKILIEEVLPLGLSTGELTHFSPVEFAQAKNAARRMLVEGTEPNTEYERWVLRFFEMMQRLPELAAEPLSLERLRDLHTQLMLDKAVGGVYRTEEIQNPETGLSVDGQGAHPKRIAREMNAIAAYGTGQQRPFVHPLIKTIVYFYWIRRVQPFVVGNGLFARLIAHIYEYQQGYRCLPCTPLTRTASAIWAVPPPGAGESRFDATVFVIKRLGVFLNAYVLAQNEVEEATHRYQGLRQRFRALDINHRQARILNRALDTPTTVFTIKRHARAWGLAYETARQDFLQLVSVGYFEQTKRGRVLEFRLARDAAKKLSPLLSS